MAAGGSINIAAPMGAITETAITRISNITALNTNSAGVFDVKATQSTHTTALGTIINGGTEVDINATIINLN